MHVLARKEIARIEDLNGQAVNVDLSGSGTAMTASLLFSTLGIDAQLTNFDQPSALEKLKQGDLAAIVFVTGQPSRLFASVPPESGLHFLSVPLTNALLATYLPAELTHASYPTLIEDGAPVATVGVGSVMAVFAWRPPQDRYAKVAHFVDAFFTKFPQLLQPPRHPKWKEVNLAAKVPGWTRFVPAEDALARQTMGGSDSSPLLRSQFDAFLVRAGVSGSLTDTQKAALYQQFIEWGNRRRDH